jgi:hypothetical protein
VTDKSRTLAKKSSVRLFFDLLFCVFTIDCGFIS